MLTKQQDDIIQKMFAGTDCFDESLALDAMEVEEMFKRLNELEEVVAIKRPVCPHCLTEMKETTFKGYYDTFDHWSCECESFKNIETQKRGGAYA